jgi:hypothetical protein
MNKIVLAITMFSCIGTSFAEEHMHSGNAMDDKRISLNLSPMMKQHQLTNMRSHVEAIQSIVELISEGDFDNASKIAHAKLGLTEEMKQMCNMFSNQDFTKLGMEFHKSADELGDVLEKRDVNLSLKALNKTMGYCVQCHAAFRQ